MAELTPELVRKIAAQVDKNDADMQARAAEKLALIREDELRRQLLSRPGSDAGWRVIPGDNPLHRLAEKNQDTATLIRQQAQDYPLIMRIVPFGGMEWWEYRPIWKLTDAELLSGPQYLKVFQSAVARGECEDRPHLWKIRQDDAGTEPTPIERYMLYQAADRIHRMGGIPYPKVSWLGTLVSWLKDATTSTEPLATSAARLFRFEKDELSIPQRIQLLTEFCPDLQRLVDWLQTMEVPAA